MRYHLCWVLKDEYEFSKPTRERKNPEVISDANIMRKFSEVWKRKLCSKKSI